MGNGESYVLLFVPGDRKLAVSYNGKSVSFKSFEENVLLQGAS